MPGLGTSFGRGGATTAQQDLANADAILIMGSSMAENHPVGFQWVMEARERGAKIIHVDPRFTRTSAMADIWVPLRAGTDMLFLGGLIHYVLENDKDFREYVVHYTNAAVILRDDFRDTEDLGGLFSGWDAEKKQYKTETWAYQGAPEKGTAERRSSRRRPRQRPRRRTKRRKHLQAGPHAAASALRVPGSEAAFFALHAGDGGRGIAACPKELFLRSGRDVLLASGPEKTGAICYAVGWTQHSNGVQIIRAAAILQLLLGNIGRPGGGILALRGHASIQGSTDIPTLYDILPGYLPMPFFESDAKNFDEYIEKHKAKTGWWNNFDKYIVSLLKAYYGEAATKENN